MLHISTNQINRDRQTFKCAWQLTHCSMYTSYQYWTRDRDMTIQVCLTIHSLLHTYFVSVVNQISRQTDRQTDIQVCLTTHPLLCVHFLSVLTQRDRQRERQTDRHSSVPDNSPTAPCTLPISTELWMGVRLSPAWCITREPATGNTVFNKPEKWPQRKVNAGITFNVNWKLQQYHHHHERLSAYT